MTSEQYKKSFLVSFKYHQAAADSSPPGGWVLWEFLACGVLLGICNPSPILDPVQPKIPGTLSPFDIFFISQSVANTTHL